jgi:lycopene beta-cyclase
MPFDIVIVGGGLSGCLTAWRLRQRHPSLKLRLIESDNRLGGNHTWSFFASDLSPDQQQWIEPVVAHRWSGYEVRFPGRRRHLASPYMSVTSELLSSTAAAALGDSVIVGTPVVEVAQRHVRLYSGETIEARSVLDARGLRSIPGLLLGYQKFVGLEVQLARPHGLDAPIIMDATVPQHDGYRFVYTLPFTGKRLLIEDTTYSDGAALPAEDMRARVLDYARSQGWEVGAIVREETGVLPIVLAGRREQVLAWDPHAATRMGLAAALFHPTTGYSLPDAVRLADRIADAIAPGVVSCDGLRTSVLEHASRMWCERAFFRLLNRMLFKAGSPAQRFEVLQRFYALDHGLIERFYAARLSKLDKARILTGWPPVPIFSALRCVSERRLLQQHEDEVWDRPEER